MDEAPRATFAGVHFWVRDMAATMAFYRLCGVEIAGGAEDGSFAHVDLPGGGSFEFGNYELTHFYHPEWEPAPGRGSNCLQFRLPSREAVDAMYARLTGAGHRGHLPPFDAFWGARYAEVLDPDGNAAGFQSPRDESRLGPQPPA